MAKTTKSTPPSSLQESILAALLFSPDAATIAGLLEVNNFDDPYRNIASAALKYRAEFKTAPGKSHIDDLFAVELSDRNSPTRRLLLGLVDLAEGLNVGYVTSRVQAFIRDQKIKAALIEANSRYEMGGDEEERAEAIEAIFAKALKERVGLTFDPIFANTERALAFLNIEDKKGYSLGIDQLDQMGFELRPQELLLFIGPKGVGKTWFCIHVGKMCLARKAKVAHVTLEFSKELMMERYFQAFHSISKTEDKYKIEQVVFNDFGGFKSSNTETKSPMLTFRDPRIQTILRSNQKLWGLRMGNLVVEQFPTGKLTIGALEAWLDHLESEHNFIPNVLIIDYPRLMKMSADNLRLDLGQTVVDLRGLAVSRNLAVVCPHQGTRETIGGKRTRSKHAGEDISVVQTADNVLAISRTDAEEELGLARLAVEHARGGRGSGDTEIIITQSYDTGQFILESALKTQEYQAKMAAKEAKANKANEAKTEHPTG